MRLSSLDHLVLTVADLERSCAFYVGVLGMSRVTFGEGRTALKFGSQKINLHPASAPIVPHATKPTAGSADLCFLTDDPLEQVIAAQTAGGVDIIEGPVPRTGATGPLTSVYCRDPDGNLVEISNVL